MEGILVIEPDGNPPVLFPSSNEFASMAQYRKYGFTIAACVLSLICACAYLFVPSLLIPALLILMLLMPILLWHYPRLAFYSVFAAVCLIEVFPTNQPDSITDRLPFFLNVNTIVQTYTGKEFKAIPFSPLEIILVVAGCASFLRGVFMKNLSLRRGPLFLPIFLYCCFVGYGWINGMLTGGDFKISLMEVRPQCYLLLAYLMAVNSLRDRRDVDRLLWSMAICIGVKGFLYTFRRYVTLAGVPISDQGVGSHEEAFLFSAYMIMLFLLTLLSVNKRLTRFMWTLSPFVVLGDLATNRRAGIGALVLGILLLMLAVDRASPHYRKRIRRICFVILVCFLIYYPVFKSSNGAFAMPAHAISSMFTPDARDAASNAYRDAENADLMATIRLAPLQGYGYGKRMLHAVPIDDISGQYEYWDVMTHNSILWVWMRLGTPGFFVFWIMVANLLIYICGTIRSEHADIYSQALGIYTLVLVSMLLVFALLDLGLVNFRNMLFVGFWAGGLVVAATSDAKPLRDSEISK